MFAFQWRNFCCFVTLLIVVKVGSDRLKCNANPRHFCTGFSKSMKLFKIKNLKSSQFLYLPGFYGEGAAVYPVPELWRVSRCAGPILWLVRAGEQVSTVRACVSVCVLESK